MSDNHFDGPNPKVKLLKQQINSKRRDASTIPDAAKRSQLQQCDLNNITYAEVNNRIGFRRIAISKTQHFQSIQKLSLKLTKANANGVLNVGELDAAVMSGRSPGRKDRKQSTKYADSVSASVTDIFSSSPLTAENSQAPEIPSNILESECEPVSWERVRPKSYKGRKLDCGDITSAVTTDPPDAGSSITIPEPDTLGRPPSVVEVDAKARETKRVANAEKGRWSWLVERYNRPSEICEPDFGPPEDLFASSIIPGQRKMGGLTGEFKPRNTMKTGSDTSQLKRRERPYEKVFDLTGPLNPPESSRPAKRPKVGGPTTAGNDLLESSFEVDGFSQDPDSPVSGHSKPAKTVQSSNSHLYHQDSPIANGISEYKRVERTVSPRMPKPRKGPSHEGKNLLQFQSGLRRSSIVSSSGKLAGDEIENSKSVSDMDDEIEDSGPENIRKSYQGTANQAPARTKSGRTGTASLAGHTSRFSSSSAKTRSADIGTRRGHSSKGLFASLTMGSDRTGHGSPDDAMYIDDDDSMDQLQLAHSNELGPVKGNGPSKENPMKAFARTASESISRDGDIPPSRLEKTRPNTATKKPESEKYLVKHIHRGSSELISDADNEVHLEFCLKGEKFDIFLNGQNESNTHRGLVIDPRKISKIRYSEESKQMFLEGPADVAHAELGKLALEFITNDSTARFAQHLLNVNRFIKVGPKRSSEYMKKLLSVQNEQIRKAARAPRQAASTPRDLELITTRQVKRQANETDSSHHPDRQQTVSERLQRSSTKDDQDKGDFNLSLLLSNLHNTRGAARIQPTGKLSQRSSPDHFPRWTLENEGWEKQWKVSSSLLFPPDGKKQANVDLRDIERLDDGEFLNDNLITFYLRYLEFNLEQSQPDVARRILFMNTFFYPKLSNGKGRNRIDYNAVKRWTAKIDIFRYDYIVVPVNEHSHWYLAIICNTPMLLNPENPEEEQESQDAVAPNKNFNVDSASIFDGNVTTSEDTLKPHTNEVSSDQVSGPKEGSLSPSVQSQVEHMSINDKDWPDNEESSHTTQKLALQSGTKSLQPTNPEFSPMIEMMVEKDSGLVSRIARKPRKGKRNSHVLRKFDVKEPRIITLDSLGTPHSPTCSNLRDFLVSEAWARHNVEIEPTISLGFTVKDIPLQDNFCDCGIFLLGYVEKFLKNPDDFVHAVFKREMDAKRDWQDMKAPQIRDKIRSLVFRLQAEQAKRETLAKKAKRAAKLEKANQMETIKPESVNKPTQEPKEPQEPVGLDILLKEQDEAQVMIGRQASDEYLSESNHKEKKEKMESQQSDTNFEGFLEDLGPMVGHESVPTNESSSKKTTIQKQSLIDHPKSSSVVSSPDHVSNTQDKISRRSLTPFARPSDDRGHSDHSSDHDDAHEEMLFEIKDSQNTDQSGANSGTSHIQPFQEEFEDIMESSERGALEVSPNTRKMTEPRTSPRRAKGTLGLSLNERRKNGLWDTKGKSKSSEKKTVVVD